MQQFRIQKSKLEGRIDPHYYRQEFYQLIDLIENGKYHTERFSNLISEIVNGLDYRNFVETGNPYLKVMNINPFVIDLEDIQYIPEFDIDKNIHLKKGDLLITRKGTFGISAVVEKKHENCIICSEILRVIVKKDIINPNYLAIWLNSVKGQMIFDRIKAGGIMGHITQKAIKKLRIPLPPFEMQERIVNIMNDTLSKQKEAKAQITNLWNESSEFIRSNLNLKQKRLSNEKIYHVKSTNILNKRLDPFYFHPKFYELDSLLSQTSYEIKSIEEINCEILSGKRPKGGVSHFSEGIPSIGGEHVTLMGTIKTHGLKYIPEDFHQKNMKSRVKIDDIIIIKDGATTGKVGITRDDFPFKEANINEHVFIIRCNNLIDPYYLLAYLKSIYGQMLIKRQITGGTVMGITNNALKNILVILPPKELQSKIADYTKKLIDKGLELDKQIFVFISKANSEIDNELF